MTNFTSPWFRWVTLLVVVLSAWFYSGPARLVPGIYNSPDEATTAVYAQEFAKTGSIALVHRDDVGSENEFLHPRSAFADFGAYSLPVGFWGLPVFYGSIINTLGNWALPFLTPLLAIVAVLALLRLWTVVFPHASRWALLGLSFSLPPLWYYAARPLLPNVPFVALLIIGAVWLIAPPDKKGLRWWHDIFGAFSIGLALLIRPSEALWVLVAGLLVVLVYRTQIAWQRVARWGAVGVVIGAVYFGLTNWWYGGLGGGYVVSRSLAVPHWWTFFLPFGLVPRNLAATLYTYGLQLWPWLILPALAMFGRHTLQWRNLDKSQKVYLVVTVFIGLYLWIYYGSWRDANYDLKTIGVAYSRYWLPAYLLLVPYVVLAYQQVAVLVSRRFSRIVLAVIIGVLIIGNANAVYSGPDGLVSLTQSLRTGAKLRTEVANHTPVQAIIATEREDKFIWPTRQVMVRFMDPRVRAAAASLTARDWPVYYLSRTLTEDQLSDLNDWLNGAEMKFGTQREVVPGYTLYQIIRVTVSF